MADLFNQQISATYSGLLKTTSNGILSSSLAQITDGRGNGSQLYLSTSKINFYNAYEFPTSDGSANQVLKTDGSGVLTWEDDISGTVTSVALTVPTGLTVTGSPITTSGTLAIGGTLGVANGGTGATTLTGILVGNGTSTISVVTDGTVGQVLSTNGSGTYSFIDSGTGDVTVDGASVGNRVAVWNNTTGELRGTSAIATENSNIYLVQPSTNGTDKFNYIIGGAFAINENDFGIQNTGFGHAVLNGADLTGGSNSSFGIQSQTALTTGSHNTSIGSFAMYDNRSGDYNVGLGAKTMFNQRISNNNVSIGYDSMDGVSASQTAESNNNVAIGYESLHIIQGGDNNTVLGYQSGSAITTGSNNVIIGSNTGNTIATSSNNIIISDGSGNNRLQFGNTGNATFSSSVTADQGIFNSTANTYAGGSLILRDLNGANPMYLTSVVGNLAISNGGATDHLTITSGGNVGIGTTPSGYLTNGYVLRLNGGAQTYIAFNNTTHTTQVLGGMVIGNDSSSAYIVQRENQPLMFSTNNTNRLTISSGGKVGIGTDSPSEMLHIKSASSSEVRLEGAGHSWYIRAYNDNYNVYSPSGRQAVSYLNNGDVRNYNNSTTWQTSSDVRVKENINTISDATSKVLALNPVIYDYKQEFAEKNNWDNDKKINNVGFIAQEFESVFPKYVSTNECVIGETTIDDFKSIDTGHLVAYLVKAIQEQQTIIEDLKSRIKTLEG